MYAGDDLLFRVKPSHPQTGRILDESTLVVKAYNPTKDPQDNSSDRADPDETISLTYTNNRLAYIGSMPTSTWTVGVWTLRFEISGEAEGSAYRTVTVQAG